MRIFRDHAVHAPDHREFASGGKVGRDRDHWRFGAFARDAQRGRSRTGPADDGGEFERLGDLPRGVGVKTYCRPVEDAYLVLEGVVTVGWELDGKVVESRLGPKDVILNPAGQPHYFRNEGLEDAQFMLVAGNDPTEQLRFEAR